MPTPTPTPTVDPLTPEKFGFTRNTDPNSVSAYKPLASGGATVLGPNDPGYTDEYHQKVAAELNGGQNGAPVLRYASTPTPATPGYYGYTPDQEKLDRDSAAAGMQNQIDAINVAADRLIREENQKATSTSGSLRAIQAAHGILDTPMSTTQDAGVETARQGVIQSIEADRASKLASLSQTIKSNQEALVASRRQEAAQNYDAAKTQAADVKTKALDSVKLIAGSGKAGLEDTLTDQDITHLMDQTGMSKLELDQYYNSQKQATNQIDWKFTTDTANNKVIAYGVDPVTKKLVEQEYQYAVPGGYKIVTTKGGQTLLYNAETGDYKPLSGVSGGGTPTVPITKILTSKQLAGLDQAGLDRGLSDAITKEILAGTSLDDIRQTLRAGGKDPKVLDMYDKVVNIAGLQSKVPYTTPKPKSGTNYADFGIPTPAPSPTP